MVSIVLNISFLFAKFCPGISMYKVTRNKYNNYLIQFSFWQLKSLSFNVFFVNTRIIFILSIILFGPVIIDTVTKS